MAISLISWNKRARAGDLATGNENTARVTALDDGGYVVVWQRNSETSEVLAQRYGANGSRVGQQITIDPGNAHNKFDAEVTVLKDGSFALTYGETIDDTVGNYDVVVERYSATGARLVDAFKVASNPGAEFGASITDAGKESESTGNFIVAWASYDDGTEDSYLRSYAADGAQLGYLQINTAVTLGRQSRPEVETLDGGQIATAYLSGTNIWLRVFANTAFGSSTTEAIVASDVANGDFHLVALANGNFVMAWTEDTSAGRNLRARIFDAGGNALTTKFSLSSNFSGYQDYPRIEALDHGGFVSVWFQNGLIKLQIFDADGHRQGPTHSVAEAVPIIYNSTEFLDIAELKDGRLVLTWNDKSDEYFLVYSQIFDPRDGNVDGTREVDLLFGNNLLNDDISGFQGADILFGLRGDDLLDGGSGNDKLNGGIGDDTMIGGRGSDTYYVDSARDVVDESDAMADGIDTVITIISVDLRDTTRFLGAIEDVFLIGTAIDAIGNALGNVLTGNGSFNTLIGLGGNDILDGRGAADIMLGVDGNDKYVVDDSGDVVDESAAGSNGTDTVLASISFKLDSAAVKGSVERLTLTGTAAISGVGNALANVITGNAGANILNGMLGSDRLNGGAGADRFDFSTALGADNIDTIVGYSVADDTIRLDDAIFSVLPTDALAGARFAANTTGTATDSADRIIYETDTGKLFYDSNGDAAGGSVQFALLAANLALTASDFLVV
ncbi:MAG: Hemolysin-type calcium-binding region [Devosia sp.]|nr:Hemolysin-type calcium-binding region [Devosia sp.]